MSANIEDVSFMACQDCFDAVNFTDDELGYTPGSIFAQQQKMLKIRPELAHALAIASGNKYENFSTGWCNGCGSTLAGSRYEILYVPAHPSK